MGVMTAPVRGSGSWPAWMTLVSNFISDCPALAVQILAPQPVQEVDARDEGEELVAVDRDRHHAALEDLAQLLHRRARRQGHEVRLHRRGHRLAEVLRVLVDP